jgi:membrane fusion protein (multidrug efflux system)
MDIATRAPAIDTGGPAGGAQELFSSPVTQTTRSESKERIPEDRSAPKPDSAPPPAPMLSPGVAVAPAARRGFVWSAVGVRLFIFALVFALVVVLAREWDWWVGSAVQQTTDDAYLQSDLTPLAAKVSGYVRQVAVRDFQRVKAGDLLVQIVDDDYRAQLEQAKATAAAAAAAIENIEQQKLAQEHAIKQAQASVAAAEADVTRYHLEAVRQQGLLNRGAGVQQTTEQAIDNEKHADAVLVVNRAQLEQQRQNLKVLESQKKQSQASLQALKAARDLAKSISATHGSSHRSTAWWVCAMFVQANMSALARR